jgi:pimeloyl-ACP methyl ester carboxylesterase
MILRQAIVGQALLFALFLSNPVAAQPAGRGNDPEPFTLITRDGVQLALTYYPSAERPGSPAAKQVTPVVMLHDLKDTRAIFGSMAARLQGPVDDPATRPPFAVVTVDLRGHGDSTRQLLPNGTQQDLDAAKTNPDNLRAMVTFDMEGVRRWLVGKNDEGAFNLNKLCLVGAGMGANVAANWAAQDWAAPPLAVVKQGQDVKALVLISPRWTYRGLNMQAPMQLTALKRSAVWLLIYGGEEQEVRSDLRRVHEQLLRFHPERDVPGASGLRSIAWPTSLQGSKLLAQNGPAIEDQVLKFLSMHVATRDLPWISRRERLPD